jgi:hypothetical protein
MSTEQERSATLATIRRRRIGPAAKQTAPKGRAPGARVKPKPSHRSHLTSSRVLLLSCASQKRVPGCGTGRLRRRERSEWERALRASGGGAA